MEGTPRGRLAQLPAPGRPDAKLERYLRVWARRVSLLTQLSHFFLWQESELIPSGVFQGSEASCPDNGLKSPVCPGDVMLPKLTVSGHAGTMPTRAARCILPKGSQTNHALLLCLMPGQPAISAEVWITEIKAQL